ncbi:MAG: HAMP domain-containing histidine kinase [Anaerolineae bacterium]|nr:HAMP domain-containing histidine kinase [Anaerolineae bacterium]
MSQDKLQQALELVTQLTNHVDTAGQPRLATLRALLEQARQAGEGAEAQAVRAQLDEVITENVSFTSVMVHEIRKPMTAMRGWVDMLSKNHLGPLNDMQSQAAQTIRNNVLSMEQLVSDISDLAKMRSGRMQPSLKMEMFKNIAMALEKDLPEEASARSVSLTFEVPSGLPLLNTDSARVEQALRKLIQNAIRYTPEETGQVTVQAEGLGDRLKVTVKDNGVGISEADQQRLGELFFRGDNELVTQTKGYGMGVPIAQHCMQLVGGELGWQSTEGVGSQFWIILPALS